MLYLSAPTHAFLYFCAQILGQQLVTNMYGMTNLGFDHVLPVQSTIIFNSVLTFQMVTFSYLAAKPPIGVLNKLNQCTIGIPFVLRSIMHNHTSCHPPAIEDWAVNMHV